MTTAIDVLRKEHDAILRMLDVTEDVATQLDRGEYVPPEILGEILEFLQLFADRCHHGKEEDVLFPILAQKGLPHVGGPLEVMLSEHVQGRFYIRQMADAGEDYRSSLPGAGRAWSDAAFAYARLLRDHIDKENNILFRIAERLLTYTEQRQIAERFDKLEEEKMGAGTHERLHVVMDRLVASVPRR